MQSSPSRIRWRAALLPAVHVCLGVFSFATLAADPAPQFDRDIRPLLVKKCFQCHGPDDKQRKAELRLDTLEAATRVLPTGVRAIVPKSPSTSELVRRIDARDDDEVMPPPQTKLALTPAEKAMLRDWVAHGAGYQSHWAFQKPRPQPPPTITGSDWARNEIDHFVLKSLASRGVSPSPRAGAAQLLRRLFLDVVGVPPSLDDLAKFQSASTDQAYDALVDRLLNDPRYGERAARFRLDLARYADTAGYEGDPEFPHAWRYRDYVIDAFNNDKPYNEFIREQIAGDELHQIMGAGELANAKPEHIVALTFLRLAPFTEPRGDETRDVMLSEMTSTVGSVFLGLTVGCAKCHDHKYDQIPTRDFYRMKAFFASVQIPPPLRGDGFQIGGPMPADFYRPGEQEWADKLRKRIEEQLRQTSPELNALRDRLMAKLKAAKANEVPKAVENPQDTRLTADEKRNFSELQQRESTLKNQLKRLLPLAMSLRHSFGPPYEPGMPPTHLLIRGEYDNPGPIVKAGFLTAVTGAEVPANYTLDPYKRWPTRGWRKLLAEWIASPDNPLTARVMVNRLWQRHFGRGIVATPSDFGSLGSAPTHPELLDWLALRFIDRKWSVKEIDRLILKSNTYRQTSIREDATADARDPANDGLFRFRRHRLEGETIRDCVLAVSGRLNDEHYGLPVFPPLPENLAEVQKVMGANRWETSHGPDGRKRSVYVYQRRSMNVPLFDVFDALVPNTPCAARKESTTSPQALELYNGSFANTEAEHFAERVRKLAGNDTQKQIDMSFRLALCRSPQPAESRRFQQFLTEGPMTEDRLAGLCRVLFNSNEFLYVD